jgi:hypothetical protein
MSVKEVTIKGRNNTNVHVTGQEELLVKVNSVNLDSTGLALDSSLNSIRTPRLISVTNTTGTIPGQPYSISIYNSGSAVGTLAVSGDTAVNIPVGATINMDAGGNSNRFATGSFVYDATNTTFLITYIS